MASFPETAANEYRRHIALYEAGVFDSAGIFTERECPNSSQYIDSIRVLLAGSDAGTLTETYTSATENAAMRAARLNEESL